MITITIKMKTDEYMQKIDKLFIKDTEMTKIDKGTYSSDKDVLLNCYDSAKQLMRRKWFRDNVISMFWNVDSDKGSDLVKHFSKRIAEGKIDVVS